MIYNVCETAAVITPQLLFYEEIIEENIKKAVLQSGDPSRLWPHIKTHKTKEIIQKSIAYGITKFKCATIAECEVAAQSGAKSILLAYPAVGPNIDRFLKISAYYHEIKWYLLFDDLHQLQIANAKAMALGQSINVFIDINLGLNRTGVEIKEVESFVEKAMTLDAISIEGLHCYDGQNGISSRADREKAIFSTIQLIEKVKSATFKLLSRSLMVIAGGTPEFPCYIKMSDYYCSPGTLFVQDYGYGELFKDMDYVQGATIMTRVISHPCFGNFTLDLGYKGIASDPAGVRGIILGFENKVEPLFQNEEHWVFKMKKGFEDLRPEVGDVLYVIPTHICPTSALYPYALVVNNHKITAAWQIAARNRKITF